MSKDQIVKYETVWSPTLKELDYAVAQKLHEGWHLYGEQLYAPGTGFRQVVVMYENKNFG